jgi:hypothetical protein
MRATGRSKRAHRFDMRGTFRDAYQAQTRWALLKQDFRRGGVSFALSSSLRVAWKVAVVNWLHLWLNMMPRKTFEYQGQTYTYLVHKSNTTWANERAIEIPIVKRLVNRYAGKRILEVGRVLSHYGPVRHDVLDKYEGAPGVILQDVISFRPKVKYDLIVSISTLEHVGFDEDVQDSEKILKAVDNLSRNCLAQDGLLVFTVPVGYNPALDQFLSDGRLPLDSMTCLLRTGSRAWRESPWDEARGAPFDSETPSANAVVVGYVHARCIPTANRQ